MLCRNCGGVVGDFDTICPNCGASVFNASQNYSQQDTREPIKTTGLLVWSIIEILCVNIITGIIGLILWITKLKPAADRGDVNEALKAKKTIKIVLWVGLIIIPFTLILIMLIAVPNFSGVQQRMQVTADRNTAAQIGKAVRIWYTDATTDLGLGLDYREVEDGFVRIDKIEGFENYSFAYEPTSPVLEYSIGEAAYYATIINEDTPTEEKIVVAVGPKNDTFDLQERYITEVNYDGQDAGIAYIEP